MRVLLVSLSLTFLLWPSTLPAFRASAAVAPHSVESMKKGATLVLKGEVVAHSSQTQKSKLERTLFASDRVFKVTVSVTEVENGEAIQTGEELTFEAWQPSSRLPLLSGPQGHQPVPDKGDLIRVYLLYNADTKTHHPYMPNGIQILRKENSKK